MSKKLGLVLLACLLALTAHSQETDEDAFNTGSVFSLKLTPGLGIPLLARDGELFFLGGGGNLMARYKIPLVPALDFDIRGEIGYNIMALKVSNSVSTISFGLGPGITWEFIPRLMLGAYGRGGIFTVS